MNQSYLIIVSEDPLELPAMQRAGELPRQLRARGHPVVLFLVQNGVLACRAGASHDALVSALAASVEVMADDFSLRERGIGLNELRAGVTAASIDAVVTRLAAGWHTLWS